MDASTYYQAYFRTQRGGLGIAYETARFELLACIGRRAVLLNEWPGRYRVAFSWHGDEADLVALAPRLGYTHALLQVLATPWSGLRADYRMVGRWPVGRIIDRGRDLRLSELWVADEEGRIARSPHCAPFAFESAPGDDTKGPRLNRRLSPLDARLIANLCGLPDGSRVLDPYAGLGAVGLAARERSLDCWVTEIDPDLTPGLRRRFPGRFALGDSRSLPFGDTVFDGVLTEPPYHRSDRAAVTESLPEIARVTRPSGVAVLLIADWMHSAVQPHPRHWREEAVLSVRRHGINCLALIWRRLRD